MDNKIYINSEPTTALHLDGTSYIEISNVGTPCRIEMEYRLNNTVRNSALFGCDNFYAGIQYRGETNCYDYVYGIDGEEYWRSVTTSGGTTSYGSPVLTDKGIHKLDVNLSSLVLDRNESIVPSGLSVSPTASSVLIGWGGEDYVKAQMDLISVNVYKVDGSSFKLAGHFVSKVVDDVPSLVCTRYADTEPTVTINGTITATTIGCYAGYYFEDEDITSINCEQTLNIVGEELSIDTLTFSVRSENIRKTSDLSKLKYATEVYWVSNGVQQDVYYVKQVTRTKKLEYRVDCISAIGLLDKVQNAGGMYTGANYVNVLNAILRKHEKIPAPETNGAVIVDAFRPDNSTGNCCLVTMSQSTGFVATVTLAYDFEESNSAELGLFGYKHSDSVGILMYVTRDELRTQNQIDYGTNLGFQYGSSTQWTGSNHNLPYLLPGEKHKIGIIPRNVSGTMHYDLYCDGVTYEDCISYSGTFSLSNAWFGFCQYIDSNRNPHAFADASFHGFTIYGSGNPVSYECGVINSSGTTFFIERDVGATTLTIYAVVEEQGFYIDGQYAFDYEIDESLQSVHVSGYLPIDSKRNNLHKLLFATNTTLVKGANGVRKFCYLDSTSVSQIADDNIYSGGEIEFQKEASEVDVTEYSYVNDASASLETMFSSDSAVSRVLVTFDKPIVSLTPSSNMTVNMFRTNYAVVSGSGTLQGLPYREETNVITVTNNKATEKKVVSSSECTLVNTLNSSLVASRLLNYYTLANTIKSSIVNENLILGNSYEIKDAFYDIQKGLLAKTSFNASATNKLSCEFISGYAPSGSGNVFSNYELLTGNGTYTIPSGVETMRVYVIGGGGGGEYGAKGSDGPQGKYRIWIGTYREGDTDDYYELSGGSSGSGGHGGKGALVNTITLTNPSGTITYNCGIGASTYANGGTATDGTASTIVYGDTTYSSATGSHGSVTNPLTGITYALSRSSKTFYGGGKGGNFKRGYSYRPSYTVLYGIYEGQGYAITHKEARIQSKGGAGSDGSGDPYVYGTYPQNEYAYLIEYTLTKGSGGGAAAGNDGYDSPQVTHDPESLTFQSGAGGNGANAKSWTELFGDVQSEITFGSGGYGGFGGGGGGCGGDLNIYGYDDYIFPPSQITKTRAAGGTGGNGGPGLKGGDGCILILY